MSELISISFPIEREQSVSLSRFELTLVLELDERRHTSLDVSDLGIEAMVKKKGRELWVGDRALEGQEL